MNKINTLKLDDDTERYLQYLLASDQGKLNEIFQKTKEDLIKQSDIVKGVIAHANTNQWADIKTIYNTSGFIILSSLDLKTYIQLLLRTTDKIEQIAIVRMIFTQIYEIGEDLNYLTGKVLQESLNKINAFSEVNDIRNVRTELTSFKSNYDEDIKSIRITIGAHREHDYTIFHDMLCSINYTTAISLVLVIDKILNNFGRVLASAMNQCIIYAKENYKKGNA
jgi:hypothetical protein